MHIFLAHSIVLASERPIFGFKPTSPTTFNHTLDQSDWHTLDLDSPFFVRFSSQWLLWQGSSHIFYLMAKIRENGILLMVDGNTMVLVFNLFVMKLNYFFKKLLYLFILVASSISEWIVATIFCFYILSFADEFKIISIDHPPIAIAGYETMVERLTILE